MSKKDWKKIGVIGVDSGLCWIGDPCYVLHPSKKIKSIGKNWSHFVDMLGEKYPIKKQLKYELGHNGFGVCVSSGLGDGTYDVLAKIVDIKG